MYAQTITTGGVPGAPFCPGESFVLTYTITGSYTVGNIFTAQRSNSVGSFASPVVIGSIASTTAGNINCTIAMGTPAGAGYLVRVILSTPSVTGSNTGPFTIDISPFPTASNTGPYCAGGTIQLNSNGGSPYTWNGPLSYSAGIQSPTIASSTIGMGGAYTVTATSAAGCTATASTFVSINAAPTPTAGNTGPYCAGTTIQLNSTGGGTYFWSGPSGYFNSTQNPTRPNANDTMDGIYTVTVTNAAGCTATTTDTVIVNALPIDSASNTGPYCIGDTIQLNSTSSIDTSDWSGPNSYSSNNTQNPTIPGATLAMSGIYIVNATNAANCSATASTTVVVIDCNAGIEDEEIMQLNIYPNPTSDLFTISLNENMIGDSKIILLNLVGQTVYSITPSQVKTMISAESLGLKAGIYLVQIKYKDQNKVVRLIVR